MFRSMPPAYAHAREQRGPLDSALGIERAAVPSKLSAAAAEVGLRVIRELQDHIILDMKTQINDASMILCEILTVLVRPEVHHAGEELSRAGGDLPAVEAGADIDKAIPDTGELAEKN